MCSMQDISRAVKIFKKNKCNFTLLHCISLYPCPEEKLNLRMIQTLKENLNVMLVIVGMSQCVTKFLLYVRCISH